MGERPYADPVTQVLAHQGGWDEILWVAGPLLVVGGLLWLANRRASRIAAGHDAPLQLSSTDDRPEP